MPLIYNETKNIFHVHIPRTGGRYIRDTFIMNNFKIKYHKFSDHIEYISGDIEHKKEIPHLEYPFYNLLPGVLGTLKFTIVRNPYDRFISLINCGYDIKKEELNDFYNYLNSKSNFDKFINDSFDKKSNYYYSNHFLPQTKYINPFVKIYKYENGLNEYFADWMKKNFNIKLNSYKINKNKYTERINYDVNILPKNLKSYIAEYYFDDFLVFNYSF